MENVMLLMTYFSKISVPCKTKDVNIKVSVPCKTKGVNVKVHNKNMITGIHKTTKLVNHISCDCKCEFNMSMQI